MRGILIGRFQPFHKGHLALLTKVLESTELKELIIAIANVEKGRTYEDPFTFAERASMVRAALSDLPSELNSKVSIVPLPYTTPPEQFAPLILEQFGPLDLLVSNNEWVRTQFQNVPHIRIPPKFFFHRSRYRGGRIRTLLSQSDDLWKRFTPAPVTKYLENLPLADIFLQVSKFKSSLTGGIQIEGTSSDSFTGSVVSGMKVAARYVETTHFNQALTKFLGAKPFPGTLNVQLLQGYPLFRERLKIRDPLRIFPRYEGNISYWNVDCFPAIIQADRENSRKAYALAIDFGAQVEEKFAVELIAHPHLRSLIRLNDGDEVIIQLL